MRSKMDGLGMLFEELLNIYKGVRKVKEIIHVNMIEIMEMSNFSIKYKKQ